MQDAEKELAEYFAYYNCDRKHSGIGYQTPIQFENNQLVHAKLWARPELRHHLKDAARQPTRRMAN